MAAYEPFTPSNSEQRLPPPYYRGCWHGVSRGFFSRYRHSPGVFPPGPFVSIERSLRPEDLHPPRGVASSGLRPLRTIPHCCLPYESGPCLSPSVAVRPLRPATDRRLGEPLPHQLANRARAPLQARGLSIPPFNNCHHAVPLPYAVLAILSDRYSHPKGILPTCYSPV